MIQKTNGVKKDTATDSKVKVLGLKLDLLRSDSVLAGRWFVDQVIDDSPVAKAGIAVKDVLIKIGTDDILSENPSLDKDVEDKLKKVCYYL